MSIDVKVFYPERGLRLAGAKDQMVALYRCFDCHQPPAGPEIV